MDYEKYFEKIKSLAKKSTLWQRIFFALLVLMVAAGSIFLLNPGKKLLEKRNSQRRSDVVNILNAVYQYKIENGGVLPEGISNVPTMICSQQATSCEGLVDLSIIVSKEKKLLSKIPTDPKENRSNISGYQIFLSSNGRINVVAPLAENNAAISLSK